MSATTPPFLGVFGGGVQSHYIASVDWNLPCRQVLELTWSYCLGFSSARTGERYHTWVRSFLWFEKTTLKSLTPVEKILAPAPSTFLIHCEWPIQNFSGLATLLNLEDLLTSSHRIHVS